MTSSSSLLAVVHQNEHAVGLHRITADGTPVGEPVVVDLSAVPGEPHELRFDPRRRRLYVSHTYLSGWYGGHAGHGHHVSVIDVDTGAPVDPFRVGAGPHDLWVDPVRDRLWATVEATDDTPGGLVAVDPDTGAVVTRIGLGTDRPHWFAVAPDGAHAHVAAKQAPYVSVLDLDAERLAGRTALPGGSEGIAAGPDGRVFVTGPCRHAGEARPGVRVIDGDVVVGLLETSGAGGAAHVTAGGLLLATDGGGTLRVWSADTLKPVGAVPVGELVLSIASSPDGRLAFAAEITGDVVTVVGLPDCRVVTTIKNTPGAHGLALVPAT